MGLTKEQKNILEKRKTALKPKSTAYGFLAWIFIILFAIILFSIANKKDWSSMKVGLILAVLLLIFSNVFRLMVSKTKKEIADIDFKLAGKNK